MPPVRTRPNTRASRKRRESIGTPARGKGKRCKQSIPVPPPPPRGPPQDQPLLPYVSEEEIPSSSTLDPNTTLELVGQIQATGTPSRPVRSSTATRHLANLKLEADRLLHRSLAPSTQQAYSAALNKFHNFLVEFHFHPFWPVPVTQLLHYIGHLSLQNMSYRTVSLYLNAIAYKHKIHGLQDTTKCFVVTKTLEGLRRSAGVTKDIHIPISYELFCRITHSQPNVCRSAYESALLSAAFTITYYGLLRVSETIALQRSDITIVHHSLCQIIIQSPKRTR
ncbi:uncharacterized protein LOC130054963 [Ostrea edulis]|uniref:uncharacterized protein LOC130054963 n=1 Tax=Ostrea edulis TaxID=37623 RepID=UPI0024AF3CF8|nr:uncharacterized protein LOC130054963 [Ostrea edulis]